MSRILLISLPVLALLGCGDSKKEKTLPSESTPVAPKETANTTADIPTNSGDTKDDVPSIAASPVTPGNAGTSPNTNTGGKDATGGNGKDTPVQNPADEGKGSSPECDMHVIDFDKKPDGQVLAAGEKIKGQYGAWGVSFEGYRRDGSNNYQNGEAITFDSAARPDEATKKKYQENSQRFGNSDGFDADLTTSENRHVLIIAENTYDAFPNDGLDRVTYPDDNSNGGKIKLYFDKPTRVIDMDVVASNGKDSEIKLFKDLNDDNEDFRKSIPQADASVVKRLTTGANDYVVKLKIILNGGGAVDNIRICVKK